MKKVLIKVESLKGKNKRMFKKGDIVDASQFSNVNELLRVDFIEETSDEQTDETDVHELGDETDVHELGDDADADELDNENGDEISDEIIDDSNDEIIDDEPKITMRNSKDEIIEELIRLNIEFDPSDTKKDLFKLL